MLLDKKSKVYNNAYHIFISMYVHFFPKGMCQFLFLEDTQENVNGGFH